MRSCSNCLYMDLDWCIDCQMATDWKQTAKDCTRYKYKEPEEEYTPSATAGDYSPSNPWDAPGMSIRDFI